MLKLEEYRCHNCNLLLYKAQGTIDTEVICPNCRRINYPHRPTDPTATLRGQDFQNMAIDLNCPVSQRLLLRVIGDGIIDVYSKHCRKTWRFDTITTRMGKKPESLEPLSEIDRTAIAKNSENLAR